MISINDIDFKECNVISVVGVEKDKVGMFTDTIIKTIINKCDIIPQVASDLQFSYTYHDPLIRASKILELYNGTPLIYVIDIPNVTNCYFNYISSSGVDFRKYNYYENLMKIINKNKNIQIIFNVKESRELYDPYKTIATNQDKRVWFNTISNIIFHVNNNNARVIHCENIDDLGQEFNLVNDDIVIPKSVADIDFKSDKLISLIAHDVNLGIEYAHKIAYSNMWNKTNKLVLVHRMYDYTNNAPDQFPSNTLSNIFANHTKCYNDMKYTEYNDLLSIIILDLSKLYESYRNLIIKDLDYNIDPTSSVITINILNLIKEYLMVIFNTRLNIKVILINEIKEVQFFSQVPLKVTSASYLSFNESICTGSTPIYLSTFIFKLYKTDTKSVLCIKSPYPNHVGNDFNLI